MITALLPVIPFAAAALLLFIPSQKTGLLKAAAISAAAACAAMTGWMFFNFNPSAGFQFLHACDVFPEMGIRYQTGADGMSLVFCLLVALVSTAAVLMIRTSVSRAKEYFFHVLILTGSLYGVFTSLNLFFMYVFYETTLIPILLLTGIGGNPALKEKGILRFAFYMTGGAIAGLLALLAMYNIWGPAFLDLTQAKSLIASAALSLETQKWLAGLLILGFGVMTALWPFHGWAPAGYSAMPSVPAAMLHAGVKTGPYFLLRIAAAYLPAGFEYWTPALALLASVGILYGGFTAMRQKNLKSMAAFSTVSHMGYVLLALAVMSPAACTAAAFLVFAHGLMSAGLFALAGYLDTQAGTDEIGAFGGLGKTLPLWSVAWIFISMASSGIPGFANFPAELMVFISAWKIFPAAVVCGVFGVLLTAVYMFRAAHALIFGTPSVPRAPLADLSCLGQKLAILLLLGALIYFGLQPGMLTGMIQPAVEALV